eukprot:NODE_5074_length_614_cov_299.382826.p4 GENE.NODE_5074_length_614_cov_299.382826~~NODE_5074_length_614_cov_299.382826.p4  ORF type:complete len:114 (+),score=46.93 NODE_5074_length_614_cov_299.382826:3-344(+)
MGEPTPAPLSELALLRADLVLAATSADLVHIRTRFVGSASRFPPMLRVLDFAASAGGVGERGDLDDLAAAAEVPVAQEYMARLERTLVPALAALGLCESGGVAEGETGTAAPP